MKIMRSAIYSFFCLMFIQVFVSCPTPTGLDENGDIDELGSLQSIEMNNNIKSLFLSESTVNSSSMMARSIDSSVLTILSYINSSSEVEPVVFETSTGARVILNISEIKQISEDCVAFKYSGYYEIESTVEGETKIINTDKTKNGTALAIFSQCKVYDITGFDLTNTIIKNNIVYTLKDSTIYKIELSNPSTAVPLNNPVYDPVSQLDLIINQSIIGSGKCFDVNGINMPVAISSELIEESTMSGVGGIFSTAVQINDNNDGLIMDENSELWGYRRSGSMIGKYKFNVNDAGLITISDYSEIDLGAIIDDGPGNSTQTYGCSKSFQLLREQPLGEHIVVGQSGYYIASESSGGGIQFEAVSYTFSGADFPNMSENPAFYDMKMVWNANNSIYCFDLSAKSLNVLYNSSSIVYPTSSISDFVLSGNNIIFYQYQNATTIGTYSIDILQLTNPVLISSSQINAMEIVELEFET